MAVQPGFARFDDRPRRHSGVKALLGVTGAMVLTVFGAASASAADIDPAYIEDFGGTPVEFGSGWYLRGDIGTFHASGSTNSGPDLTNVGWAEDISLSGGFGYSFTDRVRAGFTVSHYDNLALDSLSGDLSATLFQLDTHFSFGDLGGFSPYLGAGIGIGNVRWENPPVTGDDRSSLLAASFMAGLDYRLSDHWIVDMGYKYSMLTDISMNDSTQIFVDEMNIHELRIGLRYEIW